MKRVVDTGEAYSLPVRLYSLILLLLLSAAASSAQTSSSAVNGIVHDPSGAVITGASITLQNLDTNVLRGTVSNGTGNYLFPSVPPGRYTVRVSAPTFQSQQVQPFDVAVAQILTINLELKAGETTSTVEVNSSAVDVESTSARLGAVIGEAEVSRSPLNGRNFTQLLELTPGATPISTGQNAGGSFTITTLGSSFIFPSVNGQPNRSTMYLVDGLNDDNLWYNTYAIPPIIDTIQEFKVSSHDEAQYGQVMGGIVNVTSKSGTNVYHGAAWEYIRNNAFDGQNSFSTSNFYHQNMFGGALGGPVRIPHLYNGTDKTFFFIAEETFKYGRSNAIEFLQPTAAQLGEETWGGPQTLPYGDFSSATTGIAGCTSTTTTSTANCQLYDPTVNNIGGYRPAYVGNQIPVSEMNPGAVKFLNAVFPGPVVIPGVAPTVANGLISDPTTQTLYNYNIRVDQHIGTNNFIYLRYAGAQEDTITPQSLPHLLGETYMPARQFGGSWQHLFGPSTSLQLQFGRSLVGYDNTNTYDIPGIADTYGLSTEMRTFVGNPSMMPILYVYGYFDNGEQYYHAKNQLSGIYQFEGNMIKVMGRHQLQFGGGWNSIGHTLLIGSSTNTFTGAATANFVGNAASTVTNPTSQAGNALADFLLSRPSAVDKRNTAGYERPGGVGEAYVEDIWKITPALTLTYGLRYDRTVSPQYGTEATVGQKGGIETGDFDFNTGEYIIQKLPPLCSVRGYAPCIPGDGTLPAQVRVASGSKIIAGTKMNFGPRVGLAWRANQALAVRGGFGVLFDNWSVTPQQPANFAGSWPDTGTADISNTNTPGIAYISSQDPFASTSGNLPSATPFTAANGTYFIDPGIHNPYSEQWNFGLEQLFLHNIIGLNYVGSQSHRLDIGGFYNTGTPAPGASFATRQAAGSTGQPFPNEPTKKWEHSIGNASYNALQALVSRRFDRGLGYTIAYTWSKALDDGQSGFIGVEGNYLQDPYNIRGSRGASSFNIPQMLSIGANYNLPFGRGEQFATGIGFLDYILGYWHTDGLFVARSGTPFTIVAAGDIANTGNGNTYEHANIVGNPGLSHRTRQEWFNTSAFETPASGTYGSSGTNILETSRFFNMDLDASRSFPIHDSLQFELKVQAFNALNHPVLGGPGATVNSPASFGVISSLASSARLFQFAGKLTF